MFGRSYYLFSLLGFRIGLDASWFILAFLIVWSLSTGYFPAVIEGLPQVTYLWMGVLGALGLFASLIFHELAHAVVARQYDLRISGITLFVFGGVAQLEEEPRTAKAEFLVAIAGPIASILLSALFFGVSASGIFGGIDPLLAVIGYLAIINFILAAFNMVPAFPLDGGRILRAILWWWSGNMSRATRMAATVGGGLGIALMAFGAYNAFTGIVVAGMWQILIGFFIYRAAGMAREQAGNLPGPGHAHIGAIIDRDQPRVPADASLETAAQDYFYRLRPRILLVEDGERVVGTLTLGDYAHVPKMQWGDIPVRQVMQPLTDQPMAQPAEPAKEVLKRMVREGHTHVVIVDTGRVVGVLSRRDIMNFVEPQEERSASTATAQQAE
ncbi:site-2 protease family protein [Dichotomicrobium thermohalophilum]|uniref:Zinc metalloprotease n=1 Tax=Dichotomicrobium thermohalophilum TaxID=933063 RepID=A0A397Q805_9HYPH|nr:site-2 protease family protein [Dichotomicrobium thermohalophilum]RIA55955.1 Zn-dependent protease [Dichotomicrobium thermohalophilum]